MNKIAKTAGKLTLAIAAARGLPSIASAASVILDADPAAGNQAVGNIVTTQTGPVAVNFVGDGAVTNFSGVFSYNTTLFDAASSNATCTVVEAAGLVTVVTTNGDTPLASSTLCTITFTAVGAAGTSSPLTFEQASNSFAGGSGTTTD